MDDSLKTRNRMNRFFFLKQSYIYVVLKEPAIYRDDTRSINLHQSVIYN